MTETAREDGRMLAAALPGRRAVYRDSAVTACAAAVMAMVLGTEARSGSHGRGRLPGPPAGCAGLACQARSRAVPCGARRGPGWPCVESASDAPFLVPVSVFVIPFHSMSLKSSFRVPKAVLEQLKSLFALLKP